MSTGTECADSHVHNVVSRFLKKAWRGRKWLTSALNQKLGRADTPWALRAHGDGECRVEAPTARAAKSA